MTGERRSSQVSQGSSSMGSGGHSSNQRPSSFHPSLSRDELDSLAGEGVKLALLAKAKAIEEQVCVALFIFNKFNQCRDLKNENRRNLY